MLRTMLIVVGSVVTVLAALTGIAILTLVLLIAMADPDERKRKSRPGTQDSSRIAMIDRGPSSALLIKPQSV